MLTNQNNIQALTTIRAIKQLNKAMAQMKAMDADRDQYYAQLDECPGSDDCFSEIYTECEYALGTALRTILDLPKDFDEVVEYNNQLFKFSSWGSARLLNPMDEEALQYYEDLAAFKAGWAARHHDLDMESYVHWMDDNLILWVAGDSILICVDGYELLP